MFHSHCQQIIPDKYVCSPFKGSFPLGCVSDCVSVPKGREVTILESVFGKGQLRENVTHQSACIQNINPGSHIESTLLVSEIQKECVKVQFKIPELEYFWFVRLYNKISEEEITDSFFFSLLG